MRPTRCGRSSASQRNGGLGRLSSLGTVSRHGTVSPSEHGQPQPHAPPQQPPPPLPRGAGPAELARPPTATADSSLTVSSWPCGQVHGAAESLIGRVCSKVSPQARQRYS